MKSARPNKKSKLRTPGIWTRPSVVLSSLGINVLALALPIVILQVYDRIIPNRAEETFLILLLGMLGVIVLDTVLKILRSIVLSWDGAQFDHRESLNAMDRLLTLPTSMVTGRLT